MAPETLQEWQERQRDEAEQRRMMEESQQQEPDVVPCFRCNAAMYQESAEPMENICDSCLTN